MKLQCLYNKIMNAARSCDLHQDSITLVCTTVLTYFKGAARGIYMVTTDSGIWVVIQHRITTIHLSQQIYTQLALSMLTFP